MPPCLPAAIHLGMQGGLSLSRAKRASPGPCSRIREVGWPVAAPVARGQGGAAAPRSPPAIRVAPPDAARLAGPPTRPECGPEHVLHLQGGGAGDARTNVCGFSQNNLAVMISGVPVNEMENGWVYQWNRGGLGDASTSIRLQRGLSAANLATPSIGGTLNVMTDPSAMRSGFSCKQEAGLGSADADGEWGFGSRSRSGTPGLPAASHRSNAASVPQSRRCEEFLPYRNAKPTERHHPFVRCVLRRRQQEFFPDSGSDES